MGRRHGRLYDMNGGNAYRVHGDRTRTADPTPETIQLEASAIRMKWSDFEREVRSGMSRWRWQSPHCPWDLQRQMLESN